MYTSILICLQALLVVFCIGASNDMDGTEVKTLD